MLFTGISITSSFPGSTLSPGYGVGNLDSCVVKGHVIVTHQGLKADKSLLHFYLKMVDSLVY